MAQSLLSLAILFSSQAGTAAAADLFASDDTLELVIEAPIRSLVRNRSDKPEYDAIVRWTAPGGEARSLPARISSRGNARLEACDFPPLRLEFERDATAGTLFEGQKRLKMVTRCNAGRSASGWVLQEYGIYRAYNLLTDASYRVRRLDVTYRDSESSGREQQHPAFFIEATGSLAERLGRVELRPPEVRDPNYEPHELTLDMLFQYLIGNTDFSVRRGPEGEGCCHNGRVIGEPGSQADWFVVPYDFDQAGIINTDYALPDRRLGISRVTTRLWRGFCWQNDYIEDTAARFRALEPALREALVPDDISSSRQKRAARFIDDFFEVLNDPEELGKRLVAKCRGAASITVRSTRAR